jgi:gamma-glutamylputrescine oxidase
MQEYIDNYYSRTLTENYTRPILQNLVDADVCIIGGGLAGLATALGLLDRGKSVILLEQKSIGWGASGRNGGFVLAGYAASMESIAKKYGQTYAKQIYDLTKDAQKLIKKRIKKYNINCKPVDGHLVASWYKSSLDLKKQQEFFTHVLNEKVEYWPKEKIQELCVTDAYYDGIFFPDFFHMHPLNYLRGLARVIEDKGGKIFENSPAEALVEDDLFIVKTAKGEIRAKDVVFCGSAYFNKLNAKLSRSCLPISTYVMVTDPLQKKDIQESIRAPYAIRDNRWADDYYRLLPDNSILWGGRCGINKEPDPSDLKKLMIDDLLKIYPQLEGKVKPKVAWSGLMGYSTHKMPLIGKFKEGLWYCTNFGGNGVGPTTAGGELIASAIANDKDAYKLFDRFGFAYTGGVTGPLVAQMIYRSWELTDKIKEVKQKFIR